MMENKFDIDKLTHCNMVAKLRNTVVDLHFYAHRFLVRAKLKSEPRTGIFDALKYWNSENPLPDAWPLQLNDILKQYDKIINASPNNANDLCRETWVFLHDFDYLFRYDNRI